MARHDRWLLMAELKDDRCALVFQLIKLYEENECDSDDVSKMKALMSHILNLIYQFDKSEFRFLSERYGFSEDST